MQIDDQHREASTAPTVVSSHSGMSAFQATPAASHPETPVVSASDTFRLAALTQLGISAHLADCTDQGLHVAYEKYKAHLEACQSYERKVADGSWTGEKLTAVDLIQLFVSKSFWHLHYKPLFSKVSHSPDMVAWLEGDADRLADQVLWGYQKSVYQYKDLKGYLEEKEKKKGKGRAKLSEGGSSKKKDNRKKQVK